MPEEKSRLDGLLGTPDARTSSRLDDLLSGQIQQKTDISDIYGLAKKNYDKFGSYDQFVTPESDQESIRSSYQGTTAEVANGLGRAALNVVPSIIGNVASILDVEDYLNQDNEVGNAITRWTEELKQSTNEMLPIHGEGQLKPLDMGESEWWTSNGSNLVESAAGFAATGYGLGAAVKGVGILSKIAGASSAVQKAVQGVGGVSTAIALNQAEAVTSAIQVYDETYKKQLETTGDESTAKQLAADAAAYTINLNRLNIPLNITSSLAFLRPSEMTRQLVKKAGVTSALSNIASEGAQEFGEEVINRVAEQEGFRKGVAGKDYKYEVENTISDVFSKEGFEAGLLGFLGGVAQTGATELVNKATGKNEEQNRLYNKQAESLSQLSTLSSERGVPNLQNVISNIRDQASLVKELEDAQVEGDETKVSAIKNKILTNQAVTAFEGGTADKLEEVYDAIYKTPEEEGVAKYGKNFKQAALEAKNLIREWEKDWNRTMSTIPDTYDRKSLFKNKIEQKTLAKKINELKQDEINLSNEITSIKQNSSENVNIPQEVELKSLQSSIGRLQKMLVATQNEGLQYLKPINEQPKTPRTPSEKEKEFKQEASRNKGGKDVKQSNPSNIESGTGNEGTGTGGRDVASELNAPLVSLNEPVSVSELDHDQANDEIPSIDQNDLPNVDLGFDEEESLTESFKKAHDIFKPKKSVVDKFVEDEEWRSVGDKVKATARFSKLLQKKGLNPKTFNINTVEELFQKDGQGDYFDTNRDSIEKMISAINAFTGNETPLSYDENIPPVQPEPEKFSEASGLKRTTALNVRYKVVKTGRNGESLRSLNGAETREGDIQFENNDQTRYYDLLHTNQVREGEEVEFVLNNPSFEGDLDGLEIKIVSKDGTLRGYVSTIESINESSLDLSKDELEEERNKIRAIREFFKKNPYDKMESKIVSIGTGKLEWNGTAKSIAKIPNVQKYLHVKKNHDIVGQTPTWARNFPDARWFTEMPEGAVLLTLPEADHKGSNWSRPVTVEVGTLNANTNPSSELKAIRDEVKNELLSYLKTGKYNSRKLEQWIYVQSNKIDPARLGKNGIQLKDNTIVFNNQSYTKPEDVDFILNNLRVNVNATQLANLNSDYATRLINSGLLTSRIAYKQVGNETIFAFHPTITYDIPVSKGVSKSVTNAEDEIKNETNIDIDLDLDNLAFDIAITPATNFNIDSELSISAEDKIVDSFAYETLQGRSKDQIVKALQKALDHFKGITDESKKAAASKKINLFERVISNFDKYYIKAEQLLESLDFQRDELGFYNDFIDADNSLDQMVEEASFTENRLDSVPANIRRFLMYIPAFDKEGNPKRNALGLLSMNSIDDTYLKIGQYLSQYKYDNTRSSFNQMVTALLSHPNKTLQKVGEELGKVNNEQLQNQFYRAFNQQIIDSRTILITPKKDEGFSVRLKRSDASAAHFQLKNEWYLNFKDKFASNGTIDTEKGKTLLKKFQALIDPKFYDKAGLNQLGREELRSLLSEIGINISNSGLTSWLTNDTNYALSQNRADKSHLQTTLKFVFERLAGEGKGNIVSEDEEVITTNNPFENEAKHIESLAKHEASFSNIQGGSSFRHDGKQYSSFVRHIPLETQLESMKAMKDELLNKPVFKHSFYVQKLNDIKFIVERGLRITKKGSKAKNLKDANEKEHEVVKLLAFQKQGYFKSDTLSDKTTNVFYNAPLVKVELTNKGGLTTDVRVHLQKYFDMEYDRIRIVQSRIGATDFIDGFDSTADRKGAGEYFLTYDFLNYETLGDSEDEQFIKKYLYENARIVDIDQYSQELRSQLKNTINKLIVNRVNKIGLKVKEDWKNLGVWSDTNGVKINDIDVKYKNEIINRLKSASISPTEGNILNLAIKDYVINYMTQTIEMLWLYGDPALQSKIKYPKGINTLDGPSLIAGIKKTFENVGKRNASLMAQSEGGAWSKPTYNVAFINDIGVNAADLDQYHKDFKDSYADAKNEKMSDAQEFTTVQEHLEDRLAFGEISKNLFYLGMMHFDGEVYNSEQFKKDYPEAPAFKELSENEISQLNGILQPRKPVQVYNKFNDQGLQVKYYIKTSSVPLVPSLVKGKPMEKILKKMKSKGVQRIAFNSGVKIGLGQSQNLFEGNEINSKLFESGVHTLERKGYGIQLNVPYKEDKDAIRQVTQAMKLLFVDMDDNMKLSNGMTVKEARDRYRQIEAELVKKSKESVIEELGAAGGVISDATKLSEILSSEGEGRGYTLNTLAGLKTNKGKFKIPLTYSPSIGQIQPVLTALLNNKIVRQKIKGKSYVQVSEILNYTPKTLEGLDREQKDSIIWTKPEYKQQGKLNFLSRDGKPAQIIAPSFFLKDGKKMPLPLTEEGYLDTTKIDPSLLEMHGFRIPNQAHSSMMHFEVVGFLPEGMGDAVIVPSEIAIQMGSDYDVDKLYAYNYEYKNEEGRLVKKDSLINDLIDLHKAVILTPKMFDTVTKPQGFEDLANAIKEISSALPQDNEWLGSYNPIYQRKEYFDNAAGKTGVGIGSNHNTQHALSQQANLFIKDQGILFKKEDGSYYNETAETNRVNTYNKDLYTYQTGDKIVSMEERNDSAWRLDKVYTYSGKLISQVIAEWQGASVDNAKEKLLGTGGINDYNLSVSLTLIRAGFDNDWVLAFINQPILKEYYQTIDKLQSVFYDSFESDRRGKAIKELFKKYGISDYDAFIKAELEGYKLSEYKDMLVNKTADFNEKQANILKAFLSYERLSADLDRLQKAVSVDVKGLPKNYIETVELAKKQAALPFLKVGNATKFAETVVGPFMDVAQFATDLYSEVFDYNTPAYKSVISSIQSIQGATEFNADQLNNIYNNLYSFVYTLPNIQEAVADGKNVEDYKKSLILNDPKKTINEIYKKLGNTTKSNNVVIKPVYQQEGIQYAKSIGGVFSLRVNNSNKHFGNPFSSVPSEIAKGLIPTRSTKESVEKYIDWVINSSEDRATWIREQLKLGVLKNKPIVYYKELGEPSHATALDYLINNYNWGKNQSNVLSDRLQVLKAKYPDNFLLSRISRVLDTVNSAKRIQLNSTFSKTESYDKEVTASWLDIIKSNQQDKELRQFGLDLAAYALYYNNEPFGSSNFMKYVPIEYFDAIGFGEKLQAMRGSLEEENFFSNFVEQYYQHNVEEAKSASFITALKSGVKKAEGAFILDTDQAGPLVISVDELNKKNIKYAPYVKLYNEGKYDLFKLTATDASTLTYTKIDQLGGNSFNEYSFSKVNQTSILEENQVGKVEVPEAPTPKPRKFTYKDYFENNGKDFSSAKDLLNNVLEKTLLTNNLQFQKLAEELSKLSIDQSLTYNKIEKGVVAAVGAKEITFDKEAYKNKSDYEIQRSVLHEMIHAVTYNKINSKEFQETKEFKNLNAVWNKWKGTLSEEEVRYAEDFKKRVNSKSFEDLSEAKFNELKSKYYAYVDLHEFVAQTMTDKDFQAKLASVAGKEGSLWTEFVQAIKDIIKAITGNTLLDEAVDAVVGVINAKTKVNSSYQLGATVGDLMKEMTPDQRKLFRELREKGIFTTKC